MNKQDLVSAVKGAVDGISQKDASAAVAAVLDGITSALAEGENAQLIGFGTFRVQHKPASTGRNPSTGETIQVSARNVVKFKPGRALTDAVQ